MVFSHHSYPPQADFCCKVLTPQPCQCPATWHTFSTGSPYLWEQGHPLICATPAGQVQARLPLSPNPTMMPGSHLHLSSIGLSPRSELRKCHTYGMIGPPDLELQTLYYIFSNPSFLHTQQVQRTCPVCIHILTQLLSVCQILTTNNRRWWLNKYLHTTAPSCSLWMICYINLVSTS